MEHISEILRRQTRINTSKANTDTWSNAEAEETSPGSACPVCKGAKFVHPLLPSGKPDFGQVIPCRCTQQGLDEDRQVRLQRYSNLGSLTRLTFANLRPQGKNENPANQEQFSRAYQAAKTFAAEPKGWLVLAGPSGSGKTHLAAAIANHCIENNHPVFYVTTPDLLDHLRSTFSPNSEMPYDEFFEQVRNAPLLILDDLGAQSSTLWAKEKLEQLLNHRFSNQLPMVIVSIVPIAELEERIRTRLVTSDLCQVYVTDEASPALSTSDWAPWFELQKNMTFDNFDRERINLPLEQRQNLKAAFSLALDFAKSPDGWMVFQGVNGCGKTHLAAAIVNYRYQLKKPALFIVVPDFLDHLRSSFSPESKISYDQLFESVKSTPLLVLDDFGEQATTPWAQEKLYQVINHRYNARLSTVITTCCALEEIESRISSRLADPKISMLFNIIAPDFRGDQIGQKRTSGGGKRGR
ncbi:ATP-binding protein [Chloroflexota bacterium]